MLQSKEGPDVVRVLQEYHKEGFMTVIFIVSDSSVDGEFEGCKLIALFLIVSLCGTLIVTRRSGRLWHQSLPPLPDDEIKKYLIGPVNDYLKASNCQLMSEKLANFFVSGFGSNLAELNYFVTDVLVKKSIGEEEFLACYTNSYFDRFMSISKYSEAKTILDDLKQHGSIGYRNAYSVEAVAYLVRENIIARHNNKYMWNKRIVRVAYEEFTKGDHPRTAHD